MVPPLIVMALLLDYLGVTMPLAWKEQAKPFTSIAVSIWLALLSVSVLSGITFQDKLTGANPLLSVGSVSICLVCMMLPIYGIIDNLRISDNSRVLAVGALVMTDVFITAIGFLSLIIGTVWLVFF